MQAAHDVKFRHRFAVAFARALPDFLERHGVGLRVAHALAESAQAATGHAHVGGVDVAVDVEVGGVAVQPLAHQVGQVAHAQNVGRPVERDSLFQAQALAGRDLSGNWEQAGIVETRFHR